MLNKRRMCATSDRQLILRIVIILSVVKTCRCGYAITIHNNTDVSYLTCGEAVTLTCNFDTVPSFGMSWLLNGTNIADCISGVCYPDIANPAYINYNVGGGDTTYNLTIDAVTTAMDGTVLSCYEISSTPDNIELNVAVPIVSGNITATSNATHISISATTGCVFPYKKEDFQIDFLTSQNVSVEDYVTIITEHFEEGSVCPGSSVCDSKPVTKYIEFTERNDTEATTIYARIIHHGVEINTVPTTNKYSIVPCSSSQSLCATTKTCVNKCDNITDCSDESGEQDCSNTNNTTVTSAPTTGITSTKTYQHTNGTTPQPTINITMTSNPTILTTDSPVCVMQKPYIYLTVFGGLLIIVTSLFIIHVVYICIKKNKRKDKQTTDSRHYASLDGITTYL